MQTEKKCETMHHYINCQWVVCAELRKKELHDRKKLAFFLQRVYQRAIVGADNWQLTLHIQFN
jgi:hypothetical protein